MHSRVNDTQGEARQFNQRPLPIAPIRTAAPNALAHRLRVMANLLGQFQQQRKSGLSHRSGPVGRHIRHDNSSFSGGGKVHDICAGRQYADVFQPRKLGEMVAVQLGLICE